MTAEGARGETAEQMGRVLRYPKEARRVGGDASSVPWQMSKIHAGMSALNERFNDRKDPAEAAAIGRKIAGLERRRTQIRAEMDEASQEQSCISDRKTLSEQKVKVAAEIRALRIQIDQYETERPPTPCGPSRPTRSKRNTSTPSAPTTRPAACFPVDFKGKFEKVRLRINAWVEDQTNKRIKNLVPKGVIDPLTRLVLVNAIYFKGDWSVPFETRNTKKLRFTRSDGEKIKLPIMHARAPESGALRGVPCGRIVSSRRLRKSREIRSPVCIRPETAFAMLELPYKGDELSMVVVAPNDPGNLAAIEKQLTRKNLAGWIARLKERKVHVYLPKFKVETKYTLGDSKAPATLQKMGMVRAFVDPRRPRWRCFRRHE